MIAKLSKKNKSLIDRKIFIIGLSLLIIISIILFLFIIFKPNYFIELDIEITKYFQDLLVKKSINSIPLFIKIVHIINDMYTPYILIAIIFNFYTIYDCFLLINVLSIDYIISFCLKMIYFGPTYRYLIINNENDNQGVRIFYCGYGWGFPSEECIVLISFYLSLWKISTKLSIYFDNNHKIIKYFLLLFIIMLTFINIFGILLMGYYYLSHIIFSIITGIIVYLVIFESNLINLLDGKEFISFIEDKFILYLIINLSIFVFFSIIFAIERLIGEDGNKKDKCESIKEKNFFNYIDGNFIYAITFLGNIFGIIGIYLDFTCSHNGDKSKFYQLNFPQEWEDLMDSFNRGSFSGSIDITRETIWNKTSIIIYILRLIIILVYCAICFFPYFLINLTNSSIALVLFIKFLFPIILLFLGIFFYLKIFLRLVKLTNRTYESIVDDR